MLKITFLILFIVACQPASSQTIHLSSPDSQLQYTFRRTKTAVVYSVYHKGVELLKDQLLWLGFKEGTMFDTTLSLGKRTFNQQDPLYREVIIPVKEREGLRRTVTLIVRAYNDKILYKYEQSQSSDENFMVLNMETKKADLWQSFYVKNSND